MASRSSKKEELGTQRGTQSLQRIFFSAFFAVSAVSSSFVVAAQVPAERARTEALARRASGAAAGAAARSGSPGVRGAHAARRSAQARGRAADQSRGAQARRRGRGARSRPSSTQTAARMDALAGSQRRPSCRSCSSGWSKSTSSARHAICGCCCRRPICGVSASRRAPSPRSPSSIAIASRRTPTTLADLKKERAGARDSAAPNSPRSAPPPRRRRPRRSARRRRKTDLIRDIDKRRDLNAQLSSELQTAQQKLQATLRDLATGAAPVADGRSCRCGRSAARSTGRSTAPSRRRFGHARGAGQRHRHRRAGRRDAVGRPRRQSSRLRDRLPDSGIW